MHSKEGGLASGGTSGDGVIRLWCTEGAREEWGGGGGDG